MGLLWIILYFVQIEFREMCTQQKSSAFVNMFTADILKYEKEQIDKSGNNMFTIAIENKTRLLGVYVFNSYTLW